MSSLNLEFNQEEALNILPRLPVFLKVELSRPENQDILAELTNLKFARRTHSKRATYKEGCQGPLCRRAERDRGRRRTQLRVLREGKEYKPKPRTSSLEREAIITLIIDWHLQEKLLRGHL